MDMVVEVIMRDKNIRNKLLAKIIIILPFLFYILVATYKLATPSLWVDESIEFSSSIVNFHRLNHMIRYYSLQPPLYNWLFFLWLKINQSVFWMRLLSVLFGFIGAVGFYRSVKEVSGNTLALFSVVIYTCIFRLMYYFQEVGEYSLVLGLMCWVTFLFIRALKDTTLKNITLFSIVGILSFCSQYGAAIIVVTLNILLFLKTIIKNDKKGFQYIFVSFMLSVLVVGLPIYFLYAKYQIQKDCYAPHVFDIKIEGSLLSDFVNNFIKTLNYNFFQNLPYQSKETYMNFYIPEVLTKILLFSFFSIFVTAVFYIFNKRKNEIAIYSIVASCLSWIFLYILTKLGLYAYGIFGFRWGLFVTPLWLFTLIITFDAFLKSIKVSNSRYAALVNGIVSCFLVILTITYCSVGLYALYKHWEKENIRGVVQKWYEIGAYKEKTLLYYGAKFGFNYYLKNNELYDPSYRTNILPDMPWWQNYDYKRYDMLFKDLLHDDFSYPVIYFCVAHTSDDVQTMLKVLLVKGYKVYQVYSSYDGYIYKLEKSKTTY